MALNGIFDTTINLLGKSLDLRAQKHNRISANIANAETPGYTPTSLSFEKELQGALRETVRGDMTALNQVQGTVIEMPVDVPGLDGNGVELESEMGNLVGNQIMYNANIQFLTKKFAALTLAIKGTN